MSAVMKLASALPGVAEINGLDHLAPAAIKDPDGTLICAVVVFDVKDVRYSVKSGERIPTVEVRRAEGWLMDDTPDEVRDALLRRQEERTGRAPLPFESLGDDDE